jgi:hypothetical protein
MNDAAAELQIDGIDHTSLILGIEDVRRWSAVGVQVIPNTPTRKFMVGEAGREGCIADCNR